jgi:DNA repair photolyase
MPRHFIGQQTFKGRGSSSNVAGRFESLILEKADDGWYQDEILENPSETVLPDHARSVITSNDSPDVGFEVSINPYRGCAHGCVYCFARPTHSYLGLSPGLDFETKLFYKADAVGILEAELAKPKYVCKTIALGINTDGYQPLEKRLQVTRGILAVLTRCRHPVTIVTKSALVVRDLDLLADLAKDRLVSVMVSITSLSNDIKRTLEPRTASPQARLRVIQQLTQAGVPVGVLVAPVIPAITDHEIEDILAASKEVGASRAGYVLLRLPHELKIIFRDWLAQHYPDRAKHVMSLINQSRGGKDYDSQFGTRMRGTGPYAELLRTRFDLAKRKLGFAGAEERYELNTRLFRPPRPNTPQLSLGFD